MVDAVVSTAAVRREMMRTLTNAVNPTFIFDRPIFEAVVAF